MAADFLQDQFAQLKAQLQAINDRLATKQQEIAAIQAEKAAVVAQINDVKAAYQAWKGTGP